MTTEPRPLHTPGPWRVDERWDAFNVTADSRIGMIDICKLECGFDDPIDDDRHANAALIARAPELLARVAELEQENAEMESAINVLDQMRVQLLDARQKVIDDNARLRELLRECYKYLPRDIQVTIENEVAE